MDQMDRELRASLAGYGDGAEEDASDDDAADDERALLTNLLESVASQEGQPGPLTTLLGHLGLRVPDLSAPPQEP